MALANASTGGGGAGTVKSVTAADTSIVVAGTATDPTIATATLDVIATDHPPAAAWSNNSKQITDVANGSSAQHAAAFGQIPTALPPNGAAGGDLTGSYPSPTLAAAGGGAAGPIGDATHSAAVTVDAKGRVTALSSVSITGTAPGGSAGGDLTGSYPNPTLGSGVVVAADINAALKPSGGAAAGTESLRALGTTASTACAGNDSRLSDSRTPGAGFFGTGSDSAITLQQTTAAPAWASKSGSGATTTFTLTRDLWATTIDFDDSLGNYLVNTGGFRIFANVSIVIDAGVIVHRDGNPAVTATQGAALSGGSLATASGAGTAGAVNTTATQATQVSSSAATRSATTVAGGGAGGATTAGTGGGVAGALMFSAPSNGSPDNIAQAITLGIAAASTTFKGGAGGTGGNATGGTTATGGGGGGGGGIVAIYAKLLTNNGTIRALGGVGGAAAVGNGTAAGGGGGGGGGAVVLVYGSGSTVGTVSVAGAAGGALAGSGGTGGTGQTGIIYQLAV